MKTMSKTIMYIYVSVCVCLVVYLNASEGGINEQHRKKERKKKGTRGDDESQRPKNPNGVA